MPYGDDSGLLAIIGQGGHLDNLFSLMFEVAAWHEQVHHAPLCVNV